MKTALRLTIATFVLAGSAWDTPVDAATLDFAESYGYDLRTYSCENHLSVADFNRDGKPDLALALTGRLPLPPLQIRTGPDSELHFESDVQGWPPTVLETSSDLLTWTGVVTNFSAYVLPESKQLQKSFFRLRLVATNMPCGGRGQQCEPPTCIGKVVVLTNSGNGTFNEATTIHAGNTESYAYYVGGYDLNADGWPDLIYRLSPYTYAAINDKKGSFETVWIKAPGYDQLDVADVNGDGLLDYVAANPWSELPYERYELFLGSNFDIRGSRTDTAFAKVWGTDLGGQVVRFVDLDGTPPLDLVLCNERIATLLGGTDGHSFWFRKVAEVPLGNPVFGLAVGRVNDDAPLDIAVSVGWGKVQLYSSNGDGTLKKVWETPELGFAWNNISLADFDLDGRDDLFVGTFENPVLRIFKNRGDGTFEMLWEKAFEGDGYTGSVADLNGDRRPDLIVGGENRIRVLLNQVGN